MQLLKKYWTVVCPKCRKSRGVVYPQKSVSCHKCGKVHKVKDLRIWGRYFTLEEMKEGLTLLNEGLDGGALI